MQIELFLQMMQLQYMSSLSLGDSRGQAKDNSFAVLLALALAGSMNSGEGRAAVPPGLYMGNGKNEINRQHNYESVKAAAQSRKGGRQWDDGLNGLIARVADKYKLDPALLKAVVKVESNFNPRAVSPAGAMGLMQLMPKTAASLGVRDAFDVQENLEGGARYLKSMLDRFHGNVDLALAAYNAGPGAVKKHGGVPPYRETMEYLRTVKENRKEFFV